MTTPEAFVRDMATAGTTVEGPWDLVNTRQEYGQAIPVLLAWLERAETDVPASERQRFREGVVRSLAVTEARGRAGPALLAEFRRPGATFDYRWAVANTLEVVADQAICPELLELATERSFGPDRQMIVLALGRMKDPRVVPALCGLLDDDDVVGHALIALRRLRAREAVPAIEGCLRHPQAWVRAEAKKSLATLTSLVGDDIAFERREGAL